jgi:integrase
MSFAVLQSGSQIAPSVRTSSQIFAPELAPPQSIDDVLKALERNQPEYHASRKFQALRTTCSRLVDYFGKTLDEITLDELLEGKKKFRPFLENRKFVEGTVHKYMDCARLLLECATELGWNPEASLPSAWLGIFSLAKEQGITELVRYIARIRKSPEEVTIEDTDRWIESMTSDGHCYEYSASKKTRFWRLLRDSGCTETIPKSLLREQKYGITLKNFPPGLRAEVLALLKWKQAAISIDRPKTGRVRAVTADGLQKLLSQLFGYAVNIRGIKEINSLSELVQKPIVGAYVEWLINERKVKGEPLSRRLGGLLAAMRYHPGYQSVDLSWFKPLIDCIPTEDDDAERKEHKAHRFLEYDEAESIPEQIHADRVSAEMETASAAATLAMDELLMRFVLTFAWRQRNLRECRVGGSNPNLFKGPILPFASIDKPDWVVREEQANSRAEFWQFKFNKDETKTKINVHAILPNQLIGPLEEYLERFRPQLINGADPGTLFVAKSGKGLDRQQVTHLVAKLTARYARIRVTPHLFRDIIAYAWLKAHPKDYLTLSKILWHKDVNTTITIYGQRFNESSGVCSMESWLDSRAASKA